MVNEMNDEIDFDDETSEEDFRVRKGAIITDQSDPEIESLHKKYKRGRLILQPDFKENLSGTQINQVD